MKKKVLLVIAHPDDEVIFFWWALQNPEWECSILCCSSDANNPKRQKWAHRKLGLVALCEHLKINYKILDYESEFYKRDGRTGELAAFEDAVLESIQKFEFDFIITHNLWGEYGHADHALVHRIVQAAFPIITISSLISIASGDWTHNVVRNRYAACKFENDLVKYNELKKFYDDIRCWTWNREPIEVCSVNL